MNIVDYTNQFILPSSNNDLPEDQVAKILEFENIIKCEGDLGIKKIQKSINEYQSKHLKVSEDDFINAENKISDELKSSILVAKSNIESFALRQFRSLNLTPADTTKGISLWAETRPIDSVGLYVPGGSAPLFSSMLMQIIPAIVAGCKNIYICTPPDSNGEIHPAILWIGSILNVKNIYKIGGAQAIFSLAYGTESIPKVDKIFGPGNKFVTEAKKIVSSIVAIDMPAGPSEVFVIGEDEDKCELIAADLLSQLEHGSDSRAVFLSTNKNLITKVKNSVTNQINNLKRQDIIESSLSNLYLIKFDSIDDLVGFTNKYAPEHLIIIDEELIGLSNKINNAGSVFLGPFCPESFGDYASGSNHTLPTNGYAKTYSGLSVKDFTKTITFQKASIEGFMNLSNDVKNLALEENLDGHMKAVEIREKFLTKEEKLRTAFKFRKTNETKIYTSVNIDGTGNYSINTGIKFYDHMLEQFAKHGEFDFVIEALGDIDVDQHHTIEDVAITLADCFKEALGSRDNIDRYASSEVIVMDECKAEVAIDMASRINLNIEIPKLTEYVGDFSTEMFPHFFISFVNTLGFNCHINVIGSNSHHIVESTFKCFARSLRTALKKNNRLDNSTKGQI